MHAPPLFPVTVNGPLTRPSNSLSVLRSSRRPRPPPSRLRLLQLLRKQVWGAFMTALYDHIYIYWLHYHEGGREGGFGWALPRLSHLQSSSHLTWHYNPHLNITVADFFAPARWHYKLPQVFLLLHLSSVYLPPRRAFYSSYLLVSTFPLCPPCPALLSIQQPEEGYGRRPCRGWFRG